MLSHCSHLGCKEEEGSHSAGQKCKACWVWEGESDTGVAGARGWVKGVGKDAEGEGESIRSRGGATRGSDWSGEKGVSCRVGSWIESEGQRQEPG